mmetsp:Transcript_51799/g.60524  ORF Transcript_51799/g.60524 Transcript_51799/m.60524 type:complete len:306 (+) Transcript_51799:41-958(+)|eukprot:CAMPEP_0194378912 /NCGR_PEP_ID=MMETSP0174-20130528/37185_1 /TAXON_ID=216777 /ORGANISM="Proboscia alata, Strain PI-D3" /LENGTH=305 /DNA_ID=CAMNT_0039161243 /DNA_START=41 /DNA_END=958 /DNA_ORIENTATION=-
MKACSLAFLALMASASAFAPSPINTQSCLFSSTALYERKAFITGNWKLNPGTREEALELAIGISTAITPESPCDVALFVPFPFIESVQGIVDKKLTVGAEMVDSNINGAFTGGISTPMLDSMGVEWALAGHSERRIINKEDDDHINKQCLRIIDQGMSVMLCIGETEEEYEKDLVGSICEIQLKKGLAGISSDDMSRVAIAYEPVWAIGTGKVATPETAQQVHKICRGIITGMYGGEIGSKTRILYGGSVSDESVDGLMDQQDIDGCLVGGASLSAEKFARIINFQRVGKRKKIKNFIKKILKQG